MGTTFGVFRGGDVVVAGIAVADEDPGEAGQESLIRTTG
jgi:hypothetical protein